MIARLTVVDGTLTEYPLAERTRGGWQNGVTFYPDEKVVKFVELRVIPETSWEYGVKADGDDEPWSDLSDDLDWLLSDGAGEFISASDHVVRRYKATAWEPMPHSTEPES